MPKQPARKVHNDLFHIFPAFPMLPPRSRELQAARIRQLFWASRNRAERNIARQKEAIERLRARMAALRQKRT